MKVYLLCENIDLGYVVLDVYSSLEKIPHKLEQAKSYTLGKDRQRLEHTMPGCWDVIHGPGLTTRYVLEYEVI
jgi:hypothetical protein